MAIVEPEYIKDHLELLREEPKAFPDPLIIKAETVAWAWIKGVLRKHFDMDSVTSANADELLKHDIAKLSAAILVKRKYAVTDGELPEYVQDTIREVERNVKNAKLIPCHRQFIDYNLTPLGEPSDDVALARGVMDNKRASTDRCDIADWWDPEDDSTTDDDHVLGDQSVNT